MICCPLAYSSSLTQFYPPYLVQILGNVVTYGVKMMRLCRGWGWQSPQISFHIHMQHAHNIWAQQYAVHWHMVAAIHSFTHPPWWRLLGSGSLAESKWCDYVMVEADSHRKLLPKSILDMYKVIEHIDMLSTCIQYQPYTVIPTPLLCSDLGLWVTCGVKMMWLCHVWGRQPPQTASHIHIGNIKNDWAHWYAIHGHKVSPLHILPTLLGSDFGVRSPLVSQNYAFF